ncbi:phytoene desaturase family protein [Pseudonocardia acaciae]|uniref:phytoene desaturase family protein n=1 Tax=Pseudonocardia acaciae TaxID=551276 RepID=UPI0004901F3C|nr:NAD(P)/FAD-dependent oxidoreductase [Pseudonocardia acaciae]
MGYLDEYDGIILGAGHNGLITQAYLSRAGLKTLSIERGQHAGGGLQTPEDNSLPGFYHGTHAVSFKGISTSAWFRDLELDRWGVRFVRPDPAIVSILDDHRAIRWYSDLDRTVESIAALSERDAQAWREIATTYRELTRELLGPEQASPPIPDGERDRVLARSALGRQYLGLLPLSPKWFIEEHFEHPAVKAMLLYYCIIREVDVNVTGQGGVIPTFLATELPGELTVGGSYSLTRALKHEVFDHGGHIMEQTVPRRILVESGRAVGVELADGRRIRARSFVASSLNPQQTFLELLEPGRVGATTTGAAEKYTYQSVGQIFGVNAALRDAPDYLAAEHNPDVNDARLTFLGLDDPEDVYRLYDNARTGTLSERIMLIGGCPTVHDPSQAPPGHHAAFMWQKAPYALDGDPLNWDRHKPKQLQAILDFWRRYAPNVGGENILGSFAGSPLDTERRFPSMARGDLFHGWNGPGQRGVDRPFPGGRPYRAPEPERLYLCGSSVHPGGNVTGLPGYLAAAEIARDLGIRTWWQPNDLWSQLRARPTD